MAAFFLWLLKPLYRTTEKVALALKNEAFSDLLKKNRAGCDIETKKMYFCRPKKMGLNQSKLKV